MFGEIPIFGNSENKIDNKGRLFVPKFTGVEENDRLVVQKGQGNYYVIINFSEIEDKLRELKNSNQEGKIEIITSSIVSLVKVDKQGRIIFHPHESFAIDRKVFIHGNYDSIQVFPSEEDYINHIKELEKNR